MEERPALSDLIVCGGVGAFAGAVLMGGGIAIYGAVETGRMDNAGWAIVTVPIALMIAMPLAWPIGFGTGVVISRLLGWGHWQAGLTGGLSGLAIGLILELSLWTGLLYPLVGVGIFSGVFAWHAVGRAARFPPYAR